MTDWSRIESAIRAATGSDFRISASQWVTGGCISEARRIDGDDRSYFVKTGPASAADLFRAESDGLAALASTGAIRTPQVTCTGAVDDESWLVLEWIDLGGSADPAAMGRSLAAMHSHHGSHYGWHRDNWIGASPQRNDRSDDWATFWCSRRLAVQFDMAAARGHEALTARRHDVIERARDLLRGHAPGASLVHGDLWSGNAGYDQHSHPVIFDPAVYCGDPEVDVAMTELFGGFPPAFYQAYREVIPALPGYRLRRDMYNLYHVLNHANLFGGGYVAQAHALMSGLLQ